MPHVTYFKCFDKGDRKFQMTQNVKTFIQEWGNIHKNKKQMQKSIPKLLNCCKAITLIIEMV